MPNLINGLAIYLKSLDSFSQEENQGLRKE